MFKKNSPSSIDGKDSFFYFSRRINITLSTPNPFLPHLLIAMGKIVYPGRSIYADSKRQHIRAEAAENNALKNLTPPNGGVFL